MLVEDGYGEQNCCYYMKQFQTDGALRQHIRKQHGVQVDDFVGNSQGGKPKSNIVQDTLQYYKGFYDDHIAHEERETEEAAAEEAAREATWRGSLGPLPVFKTGKRKGQLDTTRMRKIIEEEGLSLGCVTCEENGKKKHCASKATREYCEMFDWFTTPDVESDPEPTSASLEQSTAPKPVSKAASEPVLNPSRPSIDLPSEVVQILQMTGKYSDPESEMSRKEKRNVVRAWESDRDTFLAAYSITAEDIAWYTGDFGRDDEDEEEEEV